jgi:secreted trypsin-like serine protease
VLLLKEVEKVKRIYSTTSIRNLTLDTCQGDSGGPIMYFSTKKGRWILTGIISYGYRCALRDYAGVYTRISVYIDWIKSIIDNDGIVTIEESRAIPTKASNLIIIIALSLISTMNV